MGTAPSTVRLTIRRFEAAGLTWPLPDGVTDAVLDARLFASAGAGPGTRRGHRRQAEPDWAAVHRKLKRKHVTLSILWEEYIAGEAGGYRYSRFCELYRAWEGRLSVTVRQLHAAGEKLFVDYAGDDGVPVVIDRLTGERPPRKSSSRYSAHRASPTRRRPGRRGSPTGSAATSAPSRRSVACRRCWCPTTPRSQ
jgi:transposase